MRIVNAWNIKQLPDDYVVELEDGSRAQFAIVPLRKITARDLTPYNGDDPRTCAGQPMPIHMYKFYGLEASSTAKTEVVRVRLTPEQLAKVSSVGAPSTVIRDLIDKYL